MKRFGLACCLVVGAAAVAAPAFAQEKATVKMSPVAQTPEWKALTALAGEWEGTADFGGGQTMPATVEMRMTGDGSALMHVLGKGTPHEMVTMFHQDGERLLATHYCAAHNQPRMTLVKGSTPGRLAFEFVDGTNIRPGDEHMRGVVLTIASADAHEEAWTSSSGGKTGPPAVFKFQRKKK
jgi:hypothetical protein